MESRIINLGSNHMILTSSLSLSKMPVVVIGTAPDSEWPLKVKEKAEISCCTIYFQFTE